MKAVRVKRKFGELLRNIRKNCLVDFIDIYIYKLFSLDSPAKKMERKKHGIKLLQPGRMAK